MLDLVGVQEVRWGGDGTEPAGEYTYFYGKGNQDYELGTGIFVHKRIVSVFKRVGYVYDRMSHIIILRGLNVHALSEDNIDDTKERLYEELEHVFNKFPK
jgi:hypothetical protein